MEFIFGVLGAKMSPQIVPKTMPKHTSENGVPRRPDDFTNSPGRGYGGSPLQRRAKPPPPPLLPSALIAPSTFFVVFSIFFLMLHFDYLFVDIIMIFDVFFFHNFPLLFVILRHRFVDDFSIVFLMSPNQI